MRTFIFAVACPVLCCAVLCCGLLALDSRRVGDPSVFGSCFIPGTFASLKRFSAKPLVCIGLSGVTCLYALLLGCLETVPFRGNRIALIRPHILEGFLTCADRFIGMANKTVRLERRPVPMGSQARTTYDQPTHGPLQCRQLSLYQHSSPKYPRPVWYAADATHAI